MVFPQPIGPVLGMVVFDATSSKTRFNLTAAVHGLFVPSETLVFDYRVEPTSMRGRLWDIDVTPVEELMRCAVRQIGEVALPFVGPLLEIDTYADHALESARRTHDVRDWERGALALIWARRDDEARDALQSYRANAEEHARPTVEWTMQQIDQAREYERLMRDDPEQARARLAHNRQRLLSALKLDRWAAEAPA